MVAHGVGAAERNTVAAIQTPPRGSAYRAQKTIIRSIAVDPSQTSNRRNFAKGDIVPTAQNDGDKIILVSGSRSAGPPYLKVFP